MKTKKAEAFIGGHVLCEQRQHELIMSTMLFTQSFKAPPRTPLALLSLPTCPLIKFHHLQPHLMHLLLCEKQ